MLSLNSKKNVDAYLHIIIAFICLPIYYYLGENFKYFISPYILYLFWGERPKHLPALIVHTSSGSMISFLILFLCFLKTIQHFRKFSNTTSKWLVIISFIPAPIIFYQFIIRFFYLGFSFIESILPAGFYLGIFAFYYGIIIGSKIEKSDIRIVFYTLLAIIIFNFLNIVPTLRASSFALTIFSVIGIFAFIVKKKSLTIDLFLVLSGILIILLILLGYISIQFHFLFSILFASLLFLLFIKQQRNLLTLLSNKYIILTMILIVILIITKAYEIAPNVIPFRDFSFKRISEYPNLFLYKAFADRGLLWRSTWMDLIYNKPLLPPLNINPINYVTVTGKILDFDSGAHNILLELLRIYGFIFGTLISIIYLWMLLLLGKTFSYRNIETYSLYIAVTCFAIGLIVGTTGVFVLSVNFSFLLLSLTGSVLVFSKKWQKKQILNK